MRPRVFISSIMQGYEEYRAVASRAIESAGGTAVVVEDQPALAVSPRTACLDLVASCDVLICLVGPRGGYRAPSGRLAVQEEVEEARRRNIPTLVFIQNTEHDSDAAELVNTLSAWVGGRYRLTFSTHAELQTAVQRALHQLLTTMTTRQPQNPAIIEDALREETHVDSLSDPHLRIAFAPTVADEVIDLLLLREESFERAIQTIAHDTRFFTYEQAKTTTKHAGRLAITQTTSRSKQPSAAITLTTVGLVVLSLVVTDRSASTDTFLTNAFEIQRSKLEERASTILQCAARLLDQIDPHHRYETLLHNSALVNAGHRSIVDTPARANTTTAFSLNPAKLITSHATPNPIARAILIPPADYARRIALLLQQNLRDSQRI